MRIIDHDEPHYRESKYFHDPELREAYECGVKEGWRQAMEEQYGGYNERNYGRTMPPMMREHNRGGVDYREDDWDDDYSERRYRNSMGRFTRR